MSKPWPIVRLGEVLRQFTEFIEAPEPREYRKLSVKLYGRGVVLDAPADGATLKMKHHQLAKAGQVILSEICGKKGAIGFVPPEGEGALCTSHFFLFDVLEDKLDRRWLKAIFDANYLQEQLDAQAKGTTGYAAVRPKTLLACEIPLPPLAEQRRVVGRMEALAAQIHKARTLRQQAAEEAEALFTSSLTATFDSAHWPLRPLPEVAEIARGKFAHRPRNEPRFYGGKFPFIQIGDISNSNRFIRTYSQTLNEEGLEISRMFPAGTVVIAITGATIGVTGILGFDSCFPDSIVGILAKPEFATPEFMYLAIERAKECALEASTQTTQPNINLGNLQRLKVSIPPPAEQHRIVAELDALQAQVDALKRVQAETGAELDAVLPSILDRAFRGEL